MTNMKLLGSRKPSITKSIQIRRADLADPRHHLLLAYLGPRPAGFVSAVEVFHPDKAPELSLNEIAVVEAAQRHGVARTLIENLKQVGRDLGCVTYGC